MRVRVVCAGVEEKEGKEDEEEDEVHVRLGPAWLKQEEEDRWPLVSSPTPTPAPDERLLSVWGVCACALWCVV